jgi:hypothetical protein
VVGRRKEQRTSNEKVPTLRIRTLSHGGGVSMDFTHNFFIADQGQITACSVSTLGMSYKSKWQILFEN